MERVFSRRKQKEKSQCQRLPNREESAEPSWKTLVSKAENEGWMNIETGRTKATESTENIHTSSYAHIRNIQKERNRWICTEN